MSIIFLIVVVAALFLIILYKTGGDFIAPGSIVCIMALLSLGILITYAGQYGISISIEAAILVAIAVIAVSISSILVPSKIDNIAQMKEVNCYPKVVLVFSLVFLGISTVLYFFEVLKIAISMGYTSDSPYGMLYFYRVATTTGGAASQSKIVGQTVVASVAISYLILVDFMKRIMFFGFKKDKVYLVLELATLALFVVQGILSGGRTQFLYFIEAVLFLTIFFYMKKYRSRISNKIIMVILLVIAVTYIVFFTLGSLTGKTNILDFSTTLFVYVGSPIVAFDKLIQGVVSFEESTFGQNVFWGIYDLLNRIGFDIEMHKMEAPFVPVGDAETNIYGAFARYYVDFGIVGMIIFPVIIGAIYQMFYLKMQRSNKNIELMLVIYLLCSQFLFDYCIEERFFLSVTSLGTILRIFYMVVFYYIFKNEFKIFKHIYKKLIR